MRSTNGCSSIGLFFICGLVSVGARNPIVPGVGMADPHMHVWSSDPNTVRLYATHDCNRQGGGTGPCTAEQGLGFRMKDWWVWSSSDLVNWNMSGRVLPSTFQWEDVNTTEECWATDAASFPNGTTLFYLSVGPKQIGVAISTTPTGPFHDPLGKPLIPIGLAPTYSRDPGILMDEDGSNYLIFGTFSYYMAKLNPDMITLAEELRPVKILQGQHKDDKPFLHKIGSTYYLSWGCFYAMGTSPYGPFTYVGSVINADSVVNTSFASGGGLADRHGSFFTFHGQTYFACNDRSHGGGSGFRNSIVSYVHYRSNGTIVPIRIDETGVGEYNVTENPHIDAEEYFEIIGGKKQQMRGSINNFEVVGLKTGSHLSYPKVHGDGNPMVSLRVSNGGAVAGKVELHNVSGGGDTLLFSCSINPTGSWDQYSDVTCGSFAHQSGPFEVSLRFDFFSGDGQEFAHLDRITIGEIKQGPLVV